MLRITEIFYSLQGEARYTGIPTVFVRLTGCPMRCHYCDSAYAFHGGEKFSIDQIVEQTDQYPARHVTVTGGEPLAQPECLPLLSRLCDQGYVVSLETGGAMDISGVDSRVHIVLDVKTPASGEEVNNRYENLPCIQKKDQLKFVIVNEQDYIWARDFIKERGLVEQTEVLFSPVANTLNPTDLAEWILRDGLAVRLQLQLHKHLWGDVPGV